MNIRKLRFAQLLVASFACTISICAQTDDVTPAPVPSQLATAHTAFLAAAGAAVSGIDATRDMGWLYNGMYYAILTTKQYQLLSAPTDADLSLDISLVPAPGGSMARLAIYDTKTHQLLWTIEEPYVGGVNKKAIMKGFDTVTIKLAKDLKVLASGSTSGAPVVRTSKIAPSTKNRLSQENK